MANEGSPVDTDNLFDPVFMHFENLDEELFLNGLSKDEKLFDGLPSPFMPNSEGEESQSNNEFKSDNSCNLFGDTSIPSLTSSEKQNIVEDHFSSFDIEYHENVSLSFINPPESYYHVRYISEITDSPLNGSLVNTRMKTKKNVSGRYLKGNHGRYVTITLPKIIFNCSNPYIRVTRLTIPYQEISYIHPYPLHYSSKKEKSHSHVISHDSSIYFKVTKDEIRSCSKQFPNIILTRRKQCDLNEMKNLYPFVSDNSDTYTSHPFIGDNAKNKIARYHLKKSELDFRLVNLCEQTQEFIDTGIFCRSNELLEAEGVKWRRSSS